VLAVLMTVFLLSLFGMPGLGGFMGKVYLMIAMAQIGAGGYALIAALLLNTLVSLYYYLRPVYYMMQAEDTEQRPAVVLAGFSRGVLILSAIVLFWTGLLPGMAKSAADNYATLKTRDYRESLAQIPAETMPDQPQPQDQ
jgi:NADH-quinone oxidoreductase subunit N